METIKKEHIPINRPGGFVITDRALSFCSFQPGAKVLDMGCGHGATVNYLVQNHGLEVYGIDKNPEQAYTQNNLKKASAEDLSFEDASMDGIFMECSFSLMNKPEMVLKNCYRMLKTGGYLIISDLYARGEPAQLKGCLGRMDTKEELASRIENEGFTPVLSEDYSHHLQTMWGQMIFDKGAQVFYCHMGVSPETMKRIKCGYCLIISVKNH